MSQIRGELLDSTVCRRRGLDLPLCSRFALPDRVSCWQLRGYLPGAIRSLELTVGAALEHQVVRSAKETIQGTFGQHGVGEQWVPILGCAIAGQNACDRMILYISIVCKGVSADTINHP